jgi:hypothetical protein
LPSSINTKVVWYPCLYVPAYCVQLTLRLTLRLCSDGPVG